MIGWTIFLGVFFYLEKWRPDWSLQTQWKRRRVLFSTTRGTAWAWTGTILCSVLPRSISLFRTLSLSLSLSLPVSLCLFRPDARDTTTTPSRLSICYFTPRKLYGNFHRHSWPRDDINSKSSRLICRARKLPLSRKAKRNFCIK